MTSTGAASTGVTSTGAASTGAASTGAASTGVPFASTVGFEKKRSLTACVPSAAIPDTAALFKMSRGLPP